MAEIRDEDLPAEDVVPSYTGRASVPVVPIPRQEVPPPEPVTPDPTLVDDKRPKVRGAKEAKPPLTREERRKRDKRRRILIASAAVLVMFAGFGVIAATYFYDQVITPSEMTLENSTEIYSADGQQIARLGSKNRTEISMDSLDKQVRDALIAGEDKNFYEHSGIDLWGIGRAAWNNLTGGELQGASTITQQYARIAAQDMEVTYARKLREAVMARKLEDQYEKVEIQGFYLNTVYFGRGAYGVAAAAEAYFGIPPAQIKDMNVAQAAVLGAVLRQPEPEQGGHQGYDPQNNPGDARDRWNYVLNNMVEMGWLSAAERAGMAYPEVVPFDPKTQAGSQGITDRGTGYVVKYVEQELNRRGVTKFLSDSKLGNWRSAGLKITTTIDSRVQAALEAQLNRAVEGSSLSQQRENIVGAGVAIEPSTGKVLAYYGGTNNGTLTDWASADAPHNPASSFKIYTLAAAIQDGISIQSRWDSRELKKSEGDPVDLGNANREGDPTCLDSCTLEQMTIQSFNVPFFELTMELGPQKVMQMAANAGIRTAWDDDGKPVDLTKGAPRGRDPFDYYAGIGQYGVTVLDHASGTATFANRGVYNEPYFLQKVERKNRKTGAWEHLTFGDPKPNPQRRIQQSVADEVTGVLKQIPGNQAVSGNGRESAGKTGTWENGLVKGSNAHAWFTGFTSQISATIWLGSTDYNTTPIKNPNGTNMVSAYPKSLWKRFMDKAHADLKLPGTGLPSAKNIGDLERGTGASPSPSPEPDPSSQPNPTPNPTNKPPTLPPTILPTPTGTKPGG